MDSRLRGKDETSQFAAEKLSQTIARVNDLLQPLA